MKVQSFQIQSAMTSELSYCDPTPAHEILPQCNYSSSILGQAYGWGVTLIE